MTARLNDRELDALLAGWLDEGPTTAAGSVLEQALARVPTVRRRAGWWPQLPTVLRTHGPLLAATAVLLVLAAGAALALGMITRPQPVPPSPPLVSSVDASASPTAEPSPDPSATPTPVAARGSFEFSGPVGSVPAGRTWAFAGWDDATHPGLTGYQFSYGCCGAKEFYLRIYHDEHTMTAGTYQTDRSSLIALLAWQQIAPASLGTFWSEAGECTVTFDEYGPLAARGSIECVNVPGTYAVDQQTPSTGTVSLQGTFAFNPSVRPPGEVPTPSEVPSGSPPVQ